MAENTNQEVLDGLGNDSAALEKNLGTVGRALIMALDRAVKVQTSTIEKYIDRLRRNNPDASPAEVQKLLDKHFVRLASGSGASAGAAAAIPGVGLATGAAAIAGESLLLLDVAAFHAMASAHLRGVDIRDPERRRAIVLLTMLGGKGLAVVEAFIGDLNDSENTRGNISATTALGKFSAPTLNTVNNRLTRMALKRFSRSMMRSWIGKILPLGIGAVAGTVANRALAGAITDHTAEALGPAPARFLTPPPAPKEDKENKPKKVKAERKDDKPGIIGRTFGKLRRGSDDDQAKDADDAESLTGDPDDDAELDRLALEAMEEGHSGPGNDSGTDAK